MKLHLRDMENIAGGKEIGKLAAGVSFVRKKRDKYSVEELSDLYGYDAETIERMIDFIEANPDLDDEGIAEELINNRN